MRSLLFDHKVLLSYLSNLVTYKLSLLELGHQPNRFTPFSIDTSDPQCISTPSHFHLCKERFLGIVKTRSQPHVTSLQTQQIACAERVAAASWLTVVFSMCTVWQSMNSDVCRLLSKCKGITEFTFPSHLGSIQ